ncbi:unnamed protein product [Schistosoma mattheei]|uniref:CXXC motif containing zinc binding protein n=1 Tax=Schistosoma mattheei TaxID=31246 RepID=A0AA85C5S1_9TREM|nr:unnamed protein product [Schistosoma mattheei]
MVLLGVQISCELTNVTNLSPSCDDFRWYLKVKCGNCGENTHDYVYINSVEKTPIQDSRGDANLVIRCKFCKRVSNAGMQSVYMLCIFQTSRHEILKEVYNSLTAYC